MPDRATNQQPERYRRQAAELLATRPHDGRLVTMRESRGGWRYTGLSGTCECVSADGKYLVLTVESDPEEYWPVGIKLLVELDEESVPVFEDYS